MNKKKNLTSKTFQEIISLWTNIALRKNEDECFFIFLTAMLLPLLSTPSSSQEPTQFERIAFQKAQAELGFVRIFAEYPGTTTGLLFCMAAASEQQTQSDKLGTFAGCAITVCLLSSMQNCFHVAVTTATLAFQLASNEDSREALGCEN